jgi:hypothetical protein
MRDTSHKTMISTIRDHVVRWRKAEGWSREAVVQAIVEAHERIGGPATCGIVFDPTTRDTFERMKVNADRVFRWLDDESKDNNLLPVNFQLSIWAAMPMDRRLHCIADCLGQIDVAVVGVAAKPTATFDTSLHLGSLIKESSEAQLALINTTKGTLVELEGARKEVGDVQESAARAAHALDARIAYLRNGSCGE